MRKSQNKILLSEIGKYIIIWVIKFCRNVMLGCDYEKYREKDHKLKITSWGPDIHF